MEQLVMRWKNDGVMPDMPDLGEFTLKTFDGSDEYRDRWCEIMLDGFGWQMDREGFDKCLNDHGKYDPGLVFFIDCGDESAASITVIPHDDISEGYIHMVACKKKYQGKGLGGLMNTVAVRAMMQRGLKTAYLTTDDFRIPAIRSYLRAGFCPDIIDESHRERWNSIMKTIDGTK